MISGRLHGTGVRDAWYAFERQRRRVCRLSLENMCQFGDDWPVMVQLFYTWQTTELCCRSRVLRDALGLR